MLFTVYASDGMLKNWVLQNDGSFKEKDIKVLDRTNDHLFNTVQEADGWISGKTDIEINGEIIKVNKIVSSLTDIDLYVQLHRQSKPKKLYPTKEELAILLKNGDDSDHNVLIIDFDGNLQLIPLMGRMPSSITDCAVRYETFAAGNGYVGSEESASDIDDTYQALLEGWLDHLEIGDSFYREHSDCQLTIEQLIEAIKKEIEKYK